LSHDACVSSPSVSDAPDLETSAMSDAAKFNDRGLGKERDYVSATLFRYPQFTAQGLELGAGSLIARAVSDSHGHTRLDLDKDFSRAAALLSAAYHRPIGIWQMGRLAAASEAWAKSDLPLAHTILAQARLGRLQDDEDAPARLRMAESFLDEGMAPFELLKALDLLAEERSLDKASPDDPQHPGWPAGTPGGVGGEFEPKDEATEPIGRAVVNEQQPLPPPPPKIPRKRPDDGHVRNVLIKAGVKWLIEAGLAAADITAPEVVIPLQLGVEVGSWAYPFIKAYFDGPKSLEELQEAANDPQVGYEIHHIVEQKAARKENFPEAQIQAPDNLVRIPTLKHWQLTGWFQTPNKDYGGQTPRAYLRGKTWEERQRVSLEGLRAVGVLAP
jgi:hypothetical protein